MNCQIQYLIFDENFNIAEASPPLATVFGNLVDGQSYVDAFLGSCPPIQPCGTPSREKLENLLTKAFGEGGFGAEWTCLAPCGDMVNTVKVSFTPVVLAGKRFVISHNQENDQQTPEEIIEKESSQMMRYIVETSPLPCVVLDQDFQVIKVNRATMLLHDLPYEKAYQEMFHEISEPIQPCGTPSQEKLEQEFSKVFALGKGTMLWMHRNRHTGEPIPVEVTAELVSTGDKNLLLVYGRDLRKEYELREAEQQTRIRLEAILDTSHLLSTVFDGNGIPVYNSGSGVEFYGFESKEHLDKNHHLVFPEFQPDGTRSLAHATKMIQEVAKTGQKITKLWEFQRLDGEPIPCEVSLVPLTLGGEKYVLGHTKDLREQQKLKEVYARNRERMMAMLDASPSMCIVFDQEYNCIDVNQAAAKLFGLPYPRLFLERTDDFSPEFQPCGTPSREKMNQVLQHAFDFGNHYFEWMHQTLDGNPIPCEVHLTRVTSYEKTVVIAYARDMREQKSMLAALQNAFAKSLAVEAAEESNKAKTRFLARMSHEIRTPLTAILGISEMHLQAKKLSPQMEKSFIKIHNSSHLLLGIINDLLDFSKIESGKMELSDQEYSLSNMIANVAHMHTVYLGSKGIKFIINADENLPEVLIGDPLRIEQIIINLLSNAFKYTESGSVELRVSFEPLDCGECVDLIIAIKDTGVGMTEEQLAVIYDEYTRFYKRGTHIVSGTGLGMPIVATLAQLMDAHVNVESQPNVGTTATVRIPQKMRGDEVLGADTIKRLQQFEAATISDAGQFGMPPEPMPYGKVLVVDDVDANLYVARGLLDFYDLKVETCESGFEAIKKVREGNVYDIIFMDQMMPGMSGTEAKRTLREMGYTHPIVALTANAIIGQAEEFAKEGFDDFLSKPISRKNLNAVLLKYVRDKQPLHIIEAARSAAEQLGNTDGNNADDFQNSKELQARLRSDFAKNQRNSFKNIVNAINAGDLHNAHLLAHSLKGLAGLIYEDGLAKAAAMVEQQLSKGNVPEDMHMTALESRLMFVLDSIGEVMSKGNSEISALLDDLQDLLQQRKSDAVNAIDPLRQIPEAAILVRQVERFDFKTAFGSLVTLRDILEL
ncbi:MAG: PAS domain S-box protein [Defluviitaleaceae bacterium]|nr:PAS domain S-box protein [Defluviitaleaceae bacterium]